MIRARRIGRAREKHPAYRGWTTLCRHHKFDMPDVWREDFWAFVAAIPERPCPRSRIQRPDPSRPWGPDNFFWKEPKIGAGEGVSRNAYVREWQRKAREANPEYGKNADLKRNYGVTLDWYKAKHAEQNGLCAICGCEETAVIRGKRISLAVDHCHGTGKIRGLLCRACNNAIGALKHDTDLLKAAVAYLEDQDYG